LVPQLFAEGEGIGNAGRGVADADAGGHRMPGKVNPAAPFHGAEGQGHGKSIALVDLF
jgi:hypothetical protein